MSAAAPRPAVFLDRDGTLIVERDYLGDPDGVELIPGTGPALRRLAEAGYALVLITNQSGIARGRFTEAEYAAVQERLVQSLQSEGVTLDAAYHCPHHPDFTGPCDCRKPGLALFRRAIADLGIDPARSFFVGDRPADVLPANELGGRGILVRTGYGAEVAQAGADSRLAVVDSLPWAADHILAIAPASERSKG